MVVTYDPGVNDSLSPSNTPGAARDNEKAGSIIDYDQPGTIVEGEIPGHAKRMGSPDLGDEPGKKPGCTGVKTQIEDFGTNTALRNSDAQRSSHCHRPGRGFGYPYEIEPAQGLA
jgi:hypothetical protein